MPDGAIRGITRTSLWKAWKSIRRQLRSSSLRDVVDFLEYDVDPEIWIRRLLKQLQGGTYDPTPPDRFLLPKHHGFSREMTTPMIPDLVLYRAIVDYLYARARKRERRNVYFERSTLASVTEMAESEAQETMMSYKSLGGNRFLAWLKYDQYRKYLILKKIYKYIVIKDISNFFDSILFGRVTESLLELTLPPKMVGLLFFLLERLSIREAYSESQRIGLPVDEFDCSRKLAHMVLFPHDDRMTAEVGEDAYVRWMDDQTFGVNSRAQGYEFFRRQDAHWHGST